MMRKIFGGRVFTNSHWGFTTSAVSVAFLLGAAANAHAPLLDGSPGVLTLTLRVEEKPDVFAPIDDRLVLNASTGNRIRLRQDGSRLGVKVVARRSPLETAPVS
jgi:hypothetical protein